MITPFNAYNNTLETTASPKRAEYAIFAQVTAKLTNAEQKDGKTSKIKALHDNRKLWIEVGSLVADDDNKLPMELRQRLFALSIYVQGYTEQALQSDTTCAPLIEINKSIMIGLIAHQEQAA